MAMEEIGIELDPLAKVCIESIRPQEFAGYVLLGNANHGPQRTIKRVQKRRNHEGLPQQPPRMGA